MVEGGGCDGGHWASQPIGMMLRTMLRSILIKAVLGLKVLTRHSWLSVMLQLRDPPSRSVHSWILAQISTHKLVIKERKDLPIPQQQGKIERL